MGIPSSGRTDVANMIGFSIPFYIVQPLGVLLEAAVMQIGKLLGFKGGLWTKMLGYAWVTLWLSVTALPWLDGLKNASYAAYPPLERGAETGTTLIEGVLNKAFGINLSATISTWFATLGST